MPDIINETDKATQKLIQSKIDAFNPHRRARLQETNINIAYILGHQYIGIDGSGHITKRTDVSPFAVTANKILPGVVNDIAQATKIRPKYDITPITSDEDDRATATAGQKLADYIFRYNKMDMLRGKLMLWYDIANVAWIKTYWDPYAKMTGVNPEPEEEGHDPNIPPGNPIYQGEVINIHIPTNELIYDWRQDLDALPWIIHARMMPLSEVAAKWGAERLDLLQPGDYATPGEDLNEFEIRIQTEVNRTFDPKPKEDMLPDSERMANVYEFWHVPTPSFPAGAFSVMVGKTVIINQPYPRNTYKHLQIPFSSFAALSIHQNVLGTSSIVSQVRPLQKELNEIRTLIKENAIMLSGGVWMVSREANMDWSRIDNGVGLQVEYDGVYKPKREMGVPIPGSLLAHVEAIIRDIDDLFAFHSASKGQHMSGMPRSGVGLEVLQEGDITQTGPVIMAIEKTEERAMRQSLALGFANYNERTFKIVGDDNQWSLLEFKPEMYTDGYDVTVQSGSSLPISRAMERNMVLQLWPTGLLGDPMDPSVRQKVLEVIDIGGMDKILKDEGKDMNFAKMEFLLPVEGYEKLLQEQGEIDWENVTEEALSGMIYLPTVNSFDNHTVHVREHKRDLVSKYFKWIQTGDPGMMVIAQAAVDHTNLHEAILQEQITRMAMLQGTIPSEEEAQTESGGSKSKK